MEEKDKWIKNFRNRMEDYSEPAPADLWEQLEKELDTPKVIPMWRRWQAVAAVALLVVMSSLTVWFWQSPSADYLERQSAELNSLPQPDELVVPVSPAPEQPLAQVAPAARSPRNQRMNKVAQAATIGALPMKNEELANVMTEEKQIEENNGEEQKNESVVVAETEKQQAARSSYSGKRNKYAYAAPHKKQIGRAHV